MALFQKSSYLWLIVIVLILEGLVDEAASRDCRRKRRIGNARRMVTQPVIAQVSGVDPCTIDFGNCGSNAMCSYDASSDTITCTCLTGYINNGTTNTVCVEGCLVSNGGCHSSATCIHNSGTFAIECTCPPGYIGTGSGTGLVCTAPTTTTAGPTAYLKPAHRGQKNPGFTPGACPVDPDGNKYGWHFVLPGKDTKFVSIRVVFQNAGVVTTMTNDPDTKHAYVYTPGPDTIIDASAVVSGPGREFNLSHVCSPTK